MAVEVITQILIPATATAPAGAYDLTDLATVHDELSIPATDTSNDLFLSRAITQASTAIMNYCNRTFQVEAIQDFMYIQQDPYPWQVPGGVYALQLSRWPLEDSQVVNFTATTNGTNVLSDVTPVVGIETGALVFASDGSIPEGTEIESIDGSNVTLSAAATSSETELACNTGLQVIQTLTVGDLQTLLYGRDFTIDYLRGWLIRLDRWTGVSTKWESEPTQVQYKGGFDTIPADLVDACLRLVTARLKSRGRDPALIEQTQGQMLGSQRFWVGSPPNQTGALPPEIALLVQNYRVPVIA